MDILGEQLAVEDGKLLKDLLDVPTHLEGVSRDGGWTLY
jgi:hypothetical protein